MEIIKLGAKVKIPDKNIQGEVAYIGDTHFSDGTWFGIILDNPNGKHNGTIDGIRYFKCPRNRGMFIRASYFEKECIDMNNIIKKRRSLIPKKIKYPNYLKASSKHNTEASKSISNRKVKRQSQNKKCETQCGDSVPNTNKENTKLTSVREFGDNNNVSDMKRFFLVQRYPNYLKASSKLPRNHFCLNKSRNNKTDQETTVSDHVAHNSERNLVMPEANKKQVTTDKDDDLAKKRIIYPNYLKASSKLTGKHFCVGKSNDCSTTDQEIINSEVLKNALGKSVEIQTLKECVEHINTSHSSVSNAISCVNNQMVFSKVNRTKSIETSKPKSLSKNEDHEVSEVFDIQSIQADKNMELEVVNREIEHVTNKLKSTEVSLKEALSKYDKAQEEIKHLKFDIDCQRNQIKYQKSHIKLLKKSQSYYFKKTDSVDILNKQSYQIKIGQILDSTLNNHNNNDDTKTLNDKLDSENVNSMISNNRILELEEQNRVMIQGLIELRDFLKTQCKSQSTGFESSNYDNYGQFLNRKSKKCTFSESFGRPTSLRPEEFTPEESAAPTNGCSEMLREMTKYSEIMKEKEKWLKDCDSINLEKESPRATDLLEKQLGSGNIIYSAVESTLNSSLESEFNTNTENHMYHSSDKTDCKAFQNSSISRQNDIQGNYQTAINQNTQRYSNVTTMINGKIHHYVGDRLLLEPTDSIDKLGRQEHTKRLISNEDAFMPKKASNKQDILGKDAHECGENSNSKLSGTTSNLLTDTSSKPKGMTKPSGDNPMTLTKSQQFESEIFLPLFTESYQSQEMGSMNK